MAVPRGCSPGRIPNKVKRYKHNERCRMRAVARLLAMGFLVFSVFAAQAVDLGALKGPEPVNNNFIEPEPWKEQQSALPAYPDEKDLLEVQVDDAGSGRTYYLDAKSLSTGADDVVRYTVVIVSRTGARNVLFEGIRCITREYKTYAYGAADGKLHEFPESRWELISGRGTTVYRRDLYAHYVCDPQQFALQPEKVIERVKYPTPNSNFIN